MRSNYKKLGPYIQDVVEKNTGNQIDKLLGVSIQKIFIPSIANIIGTDLSTYKIVRENQFAYGPVTSRNGEKISVALLQENDCIVSTSYTVFEITDHSKLLPEYLMMWFRRPEFDRYARYMSHGSVREIFGWEEMCNVELPIPPLEKQKEIVAEYNTIVNRIKLNEQLNQKLEETAQAIYKRWFVDFEFPVSKEYAEEIGRPEMEGKPYRSSGGEMVWNGELDGEIPVIWNSGVLLNLFELQRGFDLPIQNRKVGNYPIYAASGPSDFHSEYKVKAPGVVTGRSGSLGDVFYITKDFWPLNTTLWVKNFTNSKPAFAYFTLKGMNLIEYNGGSAVPTLNRNHVHMVDMCIPAMSAIENFEHICTLIFRQKEEVTLANASLSTFSDVLSAKMTKLEATA